MTNETAQAMRYEAIAILRVAASSKPGETLEEIAAALGIERGASVQLARRTLAESLDWAENWREARAEAAERLRSLASHGERLRRAARKQRVACRR